MPTVGGVVSGGGALETVTVTGADWKGRPRESRAVASSVCAPFLTPVVFQPTEYGAEGSSTPSFAPSRVNCTPATRRPRALTLAWTLIVPATVPPEAGEVMVTTI